MALCVVCQGQAPLLSCPLSDASPMCCLCPWAATRLQWLSRLKIYLQCRRPGFNPWLGKIPWRREWLPTPVFLPGEFHGQRSLVGYSLWGHKESDRTERITLSLSFHLDTLCPEEEGPSFFPNVSSLGMRTPFPEIPIMSLSCFIVYVGLNSHSWTTYR